MTTDNAWLTPDQAAKRLGITVRTLHRYELQGLVHPHRTPGGHRRYSADQLDALMVPEGQESA